MPLRVHVDVVSAEEQIFSGEAEFAVFPGEAGELGIFPRHAPLLTRVRPGAVRLKIPDRDEFELVYVSGGILEVQPTLITLLADTAIRAKDLDEAEAIKAKAAGRRGIAQPFGGRQLRNRGSRVGASAGAVADDQEDPQTALICRGTTKKPAPDAGFFVACEEEFIAGVETPRGRRRGVPPEPGRQLPRRRRG